MLYMKESSVHSFNFISSNIRMIEMWVEECDSLIDLPLQALLDYFPHSVKLDVPSNAPTNSWKVEVKDNCDID
jgi:hypothetical protein